MKDTWPQTQILKKLLEKKSTQILQKDLYNLKDEEDKKKLNKGKILRDGIKPLEKDSIIKRSPVIIKEYDKKYKGKIPYGHLITLTPNLQSLTKIWKICPECRIKLINNKSFKEFFPSFYSSEIAKQIDLTHDEKKELENFLKRYLWEGFPEQMENPSINNFNILLSTYTEIASTFNKNLGPSYIENTSPLFKELLKLNTNLINKIKTLCPNSMKKLSQDFIIAWAYSSNEIFSEFKKNIPPRLYNKVINNLKKKIKKLNS